MEVRPVKRRKTMMKETTNSMVESGILQFPLEILVKIFNYLPNCDIRCRVSLICKRFYEICQDESLVPVKDLCIYGHSVSPKSMEIGQEGKQYYCLSPPLIEVVSGIIRQSKYLTFLKIKALDPKTVNELVSIALQSCPKLSHLEISQAPRQLIQNHEVYWCDNIPCTISEHGKDLCSISLIGLFGNRCIKNIAEGCPKLKTLTLEPINLCAWPYSGYLKRDLKAMNKACKGLKDLKFTKYQFHYEDIEEKEIKKILPDCNVEIKECEFRELHPSSDDSSSDDFSSDSDDWSDSSSNDFSSDSDDWFDNFWGDNSSDEKQESNSEGAYEADEINGNLKKSDGEDNLYF